MNLLLQRAKDEVAQKNGYSEWGAYEVAELYSKYTNEERDEKIVSLQGELFEYENNPNKQNEEKDKLIKEMSVAFKNLYDSVDSCVDLTPELLQKSKEILTKAQSTLAQNNNQ